MMREKRMGRRNSAIALMVQSDHLSETLALDSPEGCAPRCIDQYAPNCIGTA
jgi:hypothetical protein